MSEYKGQPEPASDPVDPEDMSTGEAMRYAALTLGGGDPKRPTRSAYIRGALVIIVVGAIAFAMADRDMKHDDEVVYRRFGTAEFSPPDATLKLVMQLPADTSLAVNRAKAWQGGALLDANDRVMLTFWASQAPAKRWDGDVIESTQTVQLPDGSIRVIVLKPEVARFGSYARWEQDVNVQRVQFEVQRKNGQTHTLRVSMRAAEAATMQPIAQELAASARLVPQ